MNIISRYILSIVMTLAATVAAGGFEASAFDGGRYAAQSVLSEGRWTKIGIKESGLHFISAATLRQWGYSDMSRVRIHGYGGKRLSDRLTESGYVDDLPQVAICRTNRGIYFYGEGPETWSTASQRQTVTLNPYSSMGYYFVTESADNPPEVQSEGEPDMAAAPATDFVERLFHETDLTNIGTSGSMFVGEDFKFTRSRQFNFQLTGITDRESVWTQVTFVAAATSASRVQLTANGTQLGSPGNLAANGANYASRAIMTNTFPVESEKLTIGVTYQSNGAVSAANLDNITVNYRRAIALDRGRIAFDASRTTVFVAGADDQTIVWDVTDPLNIRAMNTRAQDGGIRFTNPYTGTRRYVAFNPQEASVPSPQSVGSVNNQNLHGITDTPDMIIVTPRDWAGEAERLARLHRSSASAPLNVLVIDQDEAFNEFSSGSRDVNGLRRMLKMFYDRGNTAGKPLRYVLLFGRATYDQRSLCTAESGTGPFVVTWQSDDSFSETGTYCSDDIMAMLDDNSGTNLAQSRISVALGRIPARNLRQARTFVDKLYSYTNSSAGSEWKNQMVMIADNANNGVFMDHSEEQQARMIANGIEMSYTKVYIDAFPIENGTCTGGRERFHRMIDDGTLWINYIGHGAERFLADEDILTMSDIDNMYNRRLPVMFAATCSFMRWDGPEMSGAESMGFNPNGGVIAAIAPTRKALITDNGHMAAAMGGAAFVRRSDGSMPTIGEMLADAKNAVRSVSNQAATTRLRFGLLGDPAMKLTMPEARVVLETIDGQDVTPDAQCTLMARQMARLTGSVVDPAGNVMTDFNGSLSLTIYDAEYSTTSMGLPDRHTEGRQVTFEEQGHKLFTGRGQVSGGHFDITVAMPSEISENFRPGAVNMYAWTGDGTDAIGCNRDIYVYGYDDTASADDRAPVIEYAYLNHESFTPGSTVNESPMFIARVSDDVSINMSMVGLGHQMTLKLDDRRTFNDLPLYYTPSPDGTTSGTIAYPMSELSEGNHTLAFRVWDTSGNSATHTLSFFVEHGAQPKLFDIFTDVNPAIDHANFYVSHNRPDQPMTVTLDIYDMLGHRVWTTTVTDRSDMFNSAPVTWDLTDMAGRRVARGIYIYRATVTTDGHELQTQAKRIAVTAP